MEGIGVDEDPQEAFKWFMRSASQGDEDSQFAVGKCYEEGLGVEADLNEAAEWYGRAAANGNSLAKKALKKLR